MKGIFKNKIFMVAAIIVVVLAAATALFSVFGPEGSSLQRIAQTVVSPVQNLFSAGFTKISHFSAAMTKYDELEAKNAELEARIRELEGLIRDAESYKEENEQLKELLKLETANPEMDLVSALIIAWNDEQWSSVFTVNKGSADGIEVGDAVIVDAGLVGIVTAVSRGSCEVSTLIDTAVSLHLNIYQNDLEVIGGGEFSLMKKDKMRLSDIPLGASVKVGDTVMTEENGNVPGGILVGNVSEIMTEGHGMSSYAVVDPEADLDRLHQVFVVTDFTRSVSGEE